MGAGVYGRAGCRAAAARLWGGPGGAPPPWTPRPAATVAGAASAANDAVDPFAAYGLDETGSAPLLRLGGGGGASRCGNYRAWQLPAWRDELNYMYLANVDEADVISGRVRHVGGVDAGRAAAAAVAAVGTDREAARASGGAGLPTTPPLEVAYDMNEYESPFTAPYDLADKNSAYDQGLYRNAAYGVYLEGYTSAVSSNGSSQQVSHALVDYGSAPSLHGPLGVVRTAVGGSAAGGTNSRPISALRPFPEPSGEAGSQPPVVFGPPVASPYGSPRTSMDVAVAAANAVRSRLAPPPPLPPSAWGSSSVGVVPAPALALAPSGHTPPVPASSNSPEATASAGAVPAWAAALVARPHSVHHSRLGSASTDGSATGAAWRPPHPMHCLPARSSSAAALTASAAAVGTPRFGAGGGGGVWSAAQPPPPQAAAGSPRHVPQRISRAAAVNAAAAVAVKARRPRAQSHWYWDPALGTSAAVSAAGSSSGFRGSGLGGGSALDTIHEEGQHATHDAPTDQAPPPPNTSPDAAGILDALLSGAQDVVLSEGEPSFGPVSPGVARELMGACRGTGQACDEHDSSGHGQPAERLHKVTSLPDLRGPPGPSQRASPPPPAGHAPRGGVGVQSGFPDRKWSHAETVSGAAATAAAAAAALLLQPMSAAAAAAAMAALAAPPSGSPDGAAGPAAQRRSLDDYWVAWALGSGLCVGVNTPTSSGSGNARATAAAPTAAGRVSVDVAVEALLGSASTPAPPTPAAAVADRGALDAILLGNAASAPPPPLPVAVTAASANANASAAADGDGFTFTRPHPVSSGTRRPRLHHHYRLDSFLTAANAQPYSHNSTARHATGSGAAAPTAKDAAAGSSANMTVLTAAAGAWGWSRAGTVNGSAAPCPRGSLSRLSISSAAAEPGAAVGPARAPAPARALVPARPLAAC
ncbi:hypothetical protein HYH03_006903 [Edaphochlamys debaryana]|uniref:Uncharacterized protein n=1 Tax=Edaphochlamys debaryana TaxID=47281 RepID=A0A835Y4E1_9CHLO|nr:hypothetical protein HYH03_006903 [Edaphochlamys debaryana]|eukprot:KAG2494969.1 hypothetical protein HYH03_006903 [Edaphochlamys debaryana]